MPVTKRDYYEILGVSKGASLKEIQRAFGERARECHPRHALPGKKQQDEIKFKELAEAYHVLSDSHKRQLYDQGGHAALKGVADTAEFSAFVDGTNEAAFWMWDFFGD